VPVSYSIDLARGVIHTLCTGYVTFAEVIDHFLLLQQDPNCPDRLDVLLDLTGSTSIPSSAQLEAVARAIGGIQEKVRFGACAIAASSDVLFGMSRVFEVLARQHFHATCVFRAVADAEEWLCSQRSSAVRSAAGEASP